MSFTPKGIILHCSDSIFGTKEIIDVWHRNRGWSECGYSFVICNGFLQSNEYDTRWNGKLQKGRALNKSQAHCIGKNTDHIGICLIGKTHFTTAQLDTLLTLLLQLCDDYSIPYSEIHAHNEYSKKTCPNFDVEVIKKMLKKGMCLPHPDFN